jgi:DNA-binding SARP family transcriptional activator
MVDAVPGESVKFSVLGPVRAWSGETETELGSPQQRTTLAMLLMREGAVVTLGELIGGMWGEEPPRSAVTTVRTYISRLRALLRDGDCSLESVGGGYALRIGPEALDLPRFRRHTARATSAAQLGDWSAAVRELRAALALWHGQPLAGALGPYARGQQTRLQQLVVTAQVDLMRAELGLGRHREVLPELAALAADHPLWEDVQGLLMRALYSSGRAAEALEHYRRARQTLVDDLGIEPGQELQRVHQRILVSDPSLACAPAGGATVLLRPRQARRGRPAHGGYHLVRASHRRLPR